MPSIAIALLVGCSSGREPSERERTDAREKHAASGDAAAAHAAAPDGGAAPAGARWSGTFRGATEIPDGGLPDGGAAWHGEGRVAVEVRGEDVSGTLEADGMRLDLRGNVQDGKLRAWVRAPAGRPRVEGLAVGAVGADKIEGTWRVSGLVGDDVRAGTFEAHR